MITLGRCLIEGLATELMMPAATRFKQLTDGATSLASVNKQSTTR